jgi:ribosomal protein S18 acetylase RimI-like enzyme
MQYRFVEESELSNLLLKESNQDIHHRIKYFYPQWAFDYLNFAAISDEGKILGLCEISMVSDPYFKSKFYHIEMISVDPEFRNQGISKNILKLVIQFCASQEANIKYGQVSSDGKSYILDQLSSICSEHNVKIIS